MIQDAPSKDVTHRAMHYIIAQNKDHGRDKPVRLGRTPGNPFSHLQWSIELVQAEDAALGALTGVHSHCHTKSWSQLLHCARVRPCMVQVHPRLVARGGENSNDTSKVVPNIDRRTTRIGVSIESYIGGMPELRLKRLEA